LENNGVFDVMDEEDEEEEEEDTKSNRRRRSNRGRGRNNGGHEMELDPQVIYYWKSKDDLSASFLLERYFGKPKIKRKYKTQITFNK